MIRACLTLEMEIRMLKFVNLIKEPKYGVVPVLTVLIGFVLEGEIFLLLFAAAILGMFLTNRSSH